MKIKAQICMVINLDKCIGCHTCSLSCNNIWTNRPGAEYMWWNNVESKPGVGYPAEWENQRKYKGGWHVKKGRLGLRAGNRNSKMIQLFYNPDLPTIDEYYEPWTYDYETLLKSPLKQHPPVAKPKSLLTGESMELKWGPNWEDDLAGAHITGKRDPNYANLNPLPEFNFEQVFMMYLPRICEHCLNPACVASCPSGAMYKRAEDGIVLVDQELCRSWRFCVSGCPYKKTYFNWKTQKAEKCIFCYPRIEVGLPTACSETCTGRLRYTGVLLYDADQVKDAALTAEDQDLYQAQLKLFLNPYDSDIAEQALKEGISPAWLEAARRSPVYKLIKEYKIALPLHPEFRTLPMVWYVPPLSPLGNRSPGPSGTQPTNQVQALDDALAQTAEQMRIPIKYLANLLSAGDTEVLTKVLNKLMVMRRYMRAINIDQEPDLTVIENLGMSKEDVESMYRLLAIAKFDERNVIPLSHREKDHNLFEEQGQTGYDFMAHCGTCNDYEVETLGVVEP